MSQRILVTCALPYANGSLHLGHLVGYTQTDIYVRALRRLGEDAHYLCASDAHGTPIEVNAGRQGIRPEDLVTKVHAEQRRDFTLYDVDFDHFGITHSERNRSIVEACYAGLRSVGQLVDRDEDGNWCETDQRFLPDRFIKGTCPRCKAADQYGDVCERCGATYATTDLLAPYCVLCRSTPVVRSSRHVFFRLSQPENVAFLRQWIDSGTLQVDVANYVRNWLDGGLRDWCISRDGPYFGFPIPDRPGKFFYVWLDAPLGYVAAAAAWGDSQGLSLAELWQSPNTRIEHVIGKDIVYFHTLFWPAVLQHMGYSLPQKVHVHGMLTVNGEKMSKSRGTFIRAATFAKHIDPQALRYYLACKSSSQSDDLDLSFDDFLLRVNAELVNKHANLFSRAGQFLRSKLNNTLGDLPFAADAAQAAPEGDGSMLDLARQVVQLARSIEASYRRREIGQVMRDLVHIADIGNEYMQAQAPWKQLREDPEAARQTCTFALNVCQALAMYLWPAVPRFADAGAALLGSAIAKMDAGSLFRERLRPLGAAARLFERLEQAAIDAVVADSVESTGQAAEGAAAAGTEAAAATPAQPPGKALVGYDTFAQLDLRVGLVQAAEAIPKSKKLLRLQVDLGEGAPRQIVAGLAQAYAPEALLGQRLVVVANLAPAKIMGHMSQGMVLAAGADGELAVLNPNRTMPGGTEVR